MSPSTSSMAIGARTLVVAAVLCSGCLSLESSYPPILPEQLSVAYRDPADLPHARIPEITQPPTVSHPHSSESQEWKLPLDAAIQTALENSEVIRVLTGLSASSTGATIYDPAIANAAIDIEQGRFDPTLEATNSFNRTETPFGTFDASPDGARIAGTRTDDYNLNLSLSKTTTSGGSANLGVNTNPSRFQPGVFPLDPQNRSSVELSYVQPLLRGGGLDPNVAPIILARLDTERSFFRFKDAVQELVRSVIEGYWGVVFARTDVWARQQQVDQAKDAYERELARKDAGLISRGAVSQSKQAFAGFRANLIGAQANLLNREAALRNVLGLPPNDQRHLIPTTRPISQRVNFDWEHLVRLAEERRPDLIELKLIVEADQQQLIIAKNQARPNIDAVGLYRWNGLEGETPSGARIATNGNAFTDWTLAVNFSVPLGLRQSRSALRQRELIIARDRANLQQGVHNTVHLLATNVRNLDQFYDQYDAFKETRLAARDNLNQQIAIRQRGLLPLNVLQFDNLQRAITDWGNAVSAEAQSLAQFNSELAALERQTGTILETHGIKFHEERWQFAGPRLRHEVSYPAKMMLDQNEMRYRDSNEPAENYFDLSNPVERVSPRPLPPSLPRDAVSARMQGWRPTKRVAGR